MRKLTYTLMLAVAFMAVSCSKTINKQYSEQNIKEDLKEIVENKDADTTDAVIIAMYVVQAEMSGEKLEGKTYQQILDKAKESANAPAK